MFHFLFFEFFFLSQNPYIANRIIANRSDLFSSYSSFDPTINRNDSAPSRMNQRKQTTPETETWAKPPKHCHRRSIPNDQTTTTSSTTTMSTKQLKSPEILEELNIKRLSELDNLLFPRIQENKKSRSTNSLNNMVEKTTEEINKERMKNKTTLLSHYFEDGKRRVDFVLVHSKPLHPNQTKGEEVEPIQQRSVFEVCFD